MKIESDKSFIFAKRRPDPFYKKFLGAQNCGLVEIDTQDIYLSPDGAIPLILTFCHEAGHVASERLSFVNGNALSFDDIKKDDVSIRLTSEERIFFQKLGPDIRKMKMEGTPLMVAKKLLRKFFKSNFNCNKIRLHNIPQLVLDIKASGGDEMSIWQERNVELSSIMTEAGCALILDNTFKKYKISFEVILYKTDSPGHQRAQNIVSKAYNGRGWRIPSVVDLENRD